VKSYKPKGLPTFADWLLRRPPSPTVARLRTHSLLETVVCDADGWQRVVNKLEALSGS